MFVVAISPTKSKYDFRFNIAPKRAILDDIQGFFNWSSVIKTQTLKAFAFLGKDFAFF
jgi:hypothetical protein